MNGSDPKVTPVDEETMASAPFFLKALVVGLGIAIIVMLGLILYKIVAGPESEPEARPAPVPTPVTALPARDFDIDAPEGATLVAMVPAGAEVFLHFRLADGSDQIIILNRATGEQSSLRVNPPSP